jgi:hypothetical protein
MSFVGGLASFYKLKSKNKTPHIFGSMHTITKADLSPSWADFHFAYCQHALVKREIKPRKEMSPGCSK